MTDQTAKCAGCANIAAPPSDFCSPECAQKHYAAISDLITGKTVADLQDALQKSERELAAMTTLNRVHVQQLNALALSPPSSQDVGEVAVTVTKSCGNVFRDLGLENADALLAESYERIINALRFKLTESEAELAAISKVDHELNAADELIKAEREIVRLSTALQKAEAELAALKHDAAQEPDHVAGKWCVSLRCARCYSADTWQASEVTRLSTALQKSEAENANLQLQLSGKHARDAEIDEFYARWPEGLDEVEAIAIANRRLFDRAEAAEAALQKAEREIGRLTADAERLDLLEKTLHIDATGDGSIFALFIPGVDPATNSGTLRELIDAAKRSETQRETPS